MPQFNEARALAITAAYDHDFGTDPSDDCPGYNTCGECVLGVIEGDENK